MAYFPMGATDAPSFNTTKYPGVCKPSNTATLELVYDLQRQLNRVAQVRGLTKTAVDGDIGPGTVKLFNAVMKSSMGCAEIGAQITMFTSSVRVLAESLQAPTQVASPTPAKPPSFVSPATGLDVVAPKPIAGKLSDTFGLSTPVLALLGVAAVGAGYYLYKRKG